jgi:hypothetical protein
MSSPSRPAAPKKGEPVDKSAVRFAADVGKSAVRWDTQRVFAFIRRDFDSTCLLLGDHLGQQPENQAKLERIKGEFAQLLRDVEWYEAVDHQNDKNKSNSLLLTSLLSKKRKLKPLGISCSSLPNATEGAVGKPHETISVRPSQSSMPDSSKSVTESISITDVIQDAVMTVASDEMETIPEHPSTTKRVSMKVHPSEVLDQNEAAEGSNGETLALVEVSKFPSVSKPSGRGRKSESSVTISTVSTRRKMSRSDTFLSKIPLLPKLLKSVSSKSVSLRDQIEVTRQMIARHEPHPYLVHPEGEKYRLWNKIVAMLLVYTLIVTVVEVCFIEPPTSISDPWLAVSLVVDFLFLCDILLTFCVPFLDTNHLKVNLSGKDLYCKNRAKIALRYIQGWFAIDVLTTIPFQLVPFLGETKQQGLGVVKALRILRLVKLVRLLKSSSMLQKLENILISDLGMPWAYYSTLSTALGFVVMLHVLGSLFHLLGSWEKGSHARLGDAAYDIDPGSRTWLTETKTYADGPSIATLPWFERYLYSCLFLATSLTGWDSLGVRFALVSTQEVVVQLVLVVVGAVLYAYTVSVVAPRLGQTTAAKASDEWHRQMDSMNHAMREVDLPIEERRKCQQLLKATREYYFLKATHEELEHAPATLKARLLLLTGQKWLEHVTFFKHLELGGGGDSAPRWVGFDSGSLNAEQSSFVQMLIPKLMPEIFLGMSLVSKHHSAPTTMYIITQGMMAAHGKLYMKTRPVVGDDIILSPWGLMRHYSIHTLSYTHTMTLTYKSLIAVLESDSYPVVSKIIRSSAMRMLFVRTMLRLARELAVARSREVVEETKTPLLLGGKTQTKNFLTRQPSQKSAVVRQSSFQSFEDLLGRSVLERQENLPVTRQKKKQRYDFFLSHKQESAGDQISTLYFQLQRYGIGCWYDNEEEEVTQAGMVKGIASSDNFLLFLTNDTFKSKWVQFEIKHAMQLKKRIVLMVEADERHHKYAFGDSQWDNFEEHHLTKEEAQSVVSKHEAITFRRKQHERFAMLQKLLQVAKIPMPVELKLLNLKENGQMFEDASHSSQHRVNTGMHRIEQKLNSILGIGQSPF